MARERNGVYAISAALAFLHVPQMYTCPCADFGAHALIAQIDVTSAGAADALRDATRQVDADIFTLNQVFSLAYAALSSFCSLSRDAQDSLCDLATSSVQHATRACKRALLASAADAHLAECRTSLTVAVYLLSWFVQEAEKQEATRMLAAAAGKTVKGKGQKKSSAKESASIWDWSTRRESGLHRLQEVRQQCPLSQRPCF